MKKEFGYWFPDYETHFPAYLSRAGGIYQEIQRAIGIRLLSMLEFPKDCAVDIGANVGLWARPLSEQFNRVVCFEPHPEVFECLRLNVNLDTVNCIQCGLGDRPHTARLEIPKSVENCGALSLVEFKSIGASEKYSTDIFIKTLDSFCIPRVSFIKIDVQGYEEAVLAGGKLTLEGNTCVLVVENSSQRLSLVNLLADFGYKLIGKYAKENYFVPVKYAKDASLILRDMTRVNKVN